MGDQCDDKFCNDGMSLDVAGINVLAFRPQSLNQADSPNIFVIPASPVYVFTMAAGKIGRICGMWSACLWHTTDHVNISLCRNLVELWALRQQFCQFLVNMCESYRRNGAERGSLYGCRTERLDSASSTGEWLGICITSCQRCGLPGNGCWAFRKLAHKKRDAMREQ